jgi:hypothetical protein
MLEPGAGGKLEPAPGGPGEQTLGLLPATNHAPQIETRHGRRVLSGEALRKGP